MKISKHSLYRLHSKFMFVPYESLFRFVCFQFRSYEHPALRLNFERKFQQLLEKKSIYHTLSVKIKRTNFGINEDK